MSIFYFSPLLIGIGFSLIEALHRLRPSSPLQLKALDWKINSNQSNFEVATWLEINNPHQSMEIMVPEIEVKTILLGNKNLNAIKVSSSIKAEHADQESREDGYWSAYIVKGRKLTRIRIDILLQSEQRDLFQHNLEGIWLDLNWVNYGPFGKIKRRQGFLVPTQRPKPLSSSEAVFLQADKCKVLPIKTHILNTFDNAIDVLREYSSNLFREGDVLTIGETPLAITQGRYLYPDEINPGWLSKLLCRAFHPTSSLATACGLQTLIDLVGPSRVIVAWIIGSGLKVLGIKGWFYRLAGDQARLIDDITGTTPPYDQTIVLGPHSSKQICEQASFELGIPVAIVDVNDLGRVKIIAASSNCKKSLVFRALLKNPAGNADQKTPIVLIRPC